MLRRVGGGGGGGGSSGRGCGGIVVGGLLEAFALKLGVADAFLVAFLLLLPFDFLLGAQSLSAEHLDRWLSGLVATKTNERRAEELNEDKPVRLLATVAKLTPF